MEKELMTTGDLARALRVSVETIRYHARSGRIPCHLTPGKHRRFVLNEVKAALEQELPMKPDPIANSVPAATGVHLDIDLSEPHREMTATAAALFAMTSGYDERALIHEHERLDPVAPLAPFTIEGTVRYAPARTFAGVGGGSY